MRFGAALLFCLMSTTASAQEFATVTTNAPIYAAAQETPTPLRVAAVGSRLRVISTEQDWVQVEYNDPVLGRRVGWVLRHYVSLGSHDLQPMDLSVPEAQPAPPAPGQPAVVPATVTSIPFHGGRPRSAGRSCACRASSSIPTRRWAGMSRLPGTCRRGSGSSATSPATTRRESTVSDDTGMTIHTFTGGPRFSARTSSAAVPFAEFLVGFTRTSLDTGGVGESSTEFTIQPGGGVDIGNERVAARLSFAWRRVFYEGSPTNMFRFVGGVVIRR